MDKRSPEYWYHLFHGVVGTLEGLDSADVVVGIPLLVLELVAV